MYPEISVNVLPVVLSVIAGVVLGFVWYGPLFGKLWARLMNMPADFKPTGSALFGSVALNVIGTVLTACALVHAINLSHPSFWKAGEDQAFFVYGFMVGLYAWAGLIVPVLLNSVAWEGRNWKLFGINAAYYFFNTQIIAMIMAAF